MKIAMDGSSVGMLCVKVTGFVANVFTVHSVVITLLLRV